MIWSCFAAGRTPATSSAIFPEIPVDDLGRYCHSYDEVGQFIACEYERVIHDTTPVTKSECRRLARELTLLGYNLQPIRQATEQHHERRRENARRQQGNTRLADEQQSNHRTRETE